MEEFVSMVIPPKKMGICGFSILSYFLHRSRELVSSVCGIFFNVSKVTTKRYGGYYWTQKWPKIGTKSWKSSLFAGRAKKSGPRPKPSAGAINKMHSGLYLLVPFHRDFCAQLFQPNATVTTSHWASSLLIEYTKDESPQQESEKGPHSKFGDLDTKYIYFTYLLLNIARPLLNILLVSNSDFPFLAAQKNSRSLVVCWFVGRSVMFVKLKKVTFRVSNGNLNLPTFLLTW